MLRRAGADKTDETMIHEELSGKIIGAGMDVLNELRPGLDEKRWSGVPSLCVAGDTFPPHLD